MSTTPPPSRPEASRKFDFSAWLPTKRVWLWILLAFGVGWLLFALIWSTGGKEEAGPPALPGDDATTVSDRYQPLPTPQSGKRVGNADRPAPAPSVEDRPQLVEEPAPLPPPVAPEPSPEQFPPAAPQGQYLSPQPIADRSPPPRYPTRALRRRQGGTVLIRADIGPDGIPVAVEVARGSGSRDLDRAAEQAVRRWRFRPALQGGQPTTGSIMVPISFNPR